MNADDTRDEEPCLGDSLGKLRDAYQATSPRDDVEEVARRAMLAAVSVVPLGGAGWNRRRAAVAGLLSLAAAAVAVVVVSDRDAGSPAERIEQSTPTTDSTASSIAVEVPEGRNAIVFATRNPLVSVVWIY